MDTPAIKFPPITPDFLLALQQRVPDQCPRPTDTDREVWMKVGEQRLIKLLMRIADEQGDTQEEANRRVTVQ